MIQHCIPGTVTVAGPVDPVSSERSGLLRALKLSGFQDTLPERHVLARQQKMGHAAFLELLLADEISRRDTRFATLRATPAGLDPAVRLETWDDAEDHFQDRKLLSNLGTLAFAEA